MIFVLLGGKECSLHDYGSCHVIFCNFGTASYLGDLLWFGGQKIATSQQIDLYKDRTM